MRALKIFGYVLAAIVALVLIGAVSLWLFIDPNRYKPQIEQLVQTQTHRKLTLQGDLKLSVFPWVALQLGPAQLGERADTERYGSQPFVTLQSARLSVRLLPLLQGRVEIGDVSLQSPTVRLITDEQGRHNWDDLTSSTAAQPAEPASGGGAINASIGAISITGAEVVLDDRRDKSQTALHDFALHAQGIGSGRPFDLDTSFAVTQSDQTKVQVTVHARVTADWNAKHYGLDDLNVGVTLHSPSLPQDGVPLTARMKSLALDLNQQTLDAQGLALSVGPAQLNGNLAGTDVIDAPKLTGHIELAQVALPQLMKALGVTPPATRDAKALQRLSFSSDVNATSSSVDLQKLTMQLDDTTARGSFGVADLKAKALRMNLDVDRIDLDRYLPPVAVDSKAAATNSAPTPIPVDPLRTLNLRGDLRIGAAQFSGLKLSKLRVAVVARNGDIHIAPAQAALYGGTLKSDITLNVAAATPQLALKTNVAGVDFAPLLKDMLDMKRIAGRGTLDANLTAAGRDTDAMLRTLGGKLAFNIADGAYEGMDLWYEIRRARALLRQQPIPARTGAERTTFTAIKGSGTVTNGVFNNPDLNVAMQYLKVDGKGTVDLVKGTMNYNLNAKVLRIPPEGAAGSEMTDLVDAEIPITAKGPLASPTVRPDIEGYVKARAKQEVQKQTDKLKDKLQNKLQDLLRGR